MALTPSTSFTQDINDIYAGVVADTTPNYGTGGNPARNAAANYLLWAKTDKNGNRTYNNPLPGDVLTIMQWSVTMSVGGWYERMLMRIQPYNNGTPYVIEQESGGVITVYASIVYYASTNLVYKRIGSDGSGNLPTDTNFWEVVTDLSTLISNTNVSTTISNTYVRAIADAGVKALFKNMQKTCGCDETANKKAYFLDGMLISADADVQSGNYDDMETAISYLESQLIQSS